MDSIRVNKTIAVRVWSASYIPSCTGLPKTGATNQNAPRLISEYLCLLRQRNDLNSITIVKEIPWVKGQIEKQRLGLFREGPFALVDTWETRITDHYRPIFQLVRNVRFIQSASSNSLSQFRQLIHFSYSHFYCVIKFLLNKKHTRPLLYAKGRAPPD